MGNAQGNSSMSDAASNDSDSPDDPVYLHTRREALVILGLWAAALVWVVSFTYAHGYYSLKDPNQLKTVWGIPDWVFWGVFVPWIVCDVIAIGLALWFIADDDLEPAGAESSEHDDGD